MKKLFVLVLVLALAITGTSFAERVTMRYNFGITTDSTTQYQIGCTGIQKSENEWYIVLNTSKSNLSPTHRAVTRVHNGANAASATWVYSGANATHHPYKTNCQGPMYNLSYRGRLDNRDSGTLKFYGQFVTFFESGN